MAARLVRQQMYIAINKDVVELQDLYPGALGRSADLSRKVKLASPCEIFEAAGTEATHDSYHQVRIILFILFCFSFCETLGLTAHSITLHRSR